MPQNALSQRWMPSPVGTLRLVATDVALVGVYFPEHRHAPHIDAEDVATHLVLDRAVQQLGEYFTGARTTFDLPLAAAGTPFQRAVWDALAAIPFGATRSYGELARAAGRPAAVRAVGSANGLNALSIFVPCHRVIAGDGSLTGYAGGLAAKRWLLEHERRRMGIGGAANTVAEGRQQRLL